ncbi:MAG: hypothetical protein AW07_02335 [Candidatus Accumulibacter sp. SK-11]|nr:MAG: hypothetical protein AW07_02335 [Candidatus Accumulibacter sp. SK-11]
MMARPILPVKTDCGTSVVADRLTDADLLRKTPRCEQTR